jgi:acylphosphatase
MNDTIRRVIIRGRVQGVGYRAWIDHQARRAGLQGWVRNRRDGSVEAVFDGTEDTVARIVVSCRSGPPSAQVDDVAEEAASADELGLRRPGEAFSVLPTI